MVDSFTILQALAPCDKPQNVKQVCALIGIDSTIAASKLVLKCLGRLHASGFLDRVSRFAVVSSPADEGREPAAQAPTTRSFWLVSKAGHDLLGVKDPQVGRGKHHARGASIKRETLRARAWRAFRMMDGRASVPDILELAKRKTDDGKSAQANIQKFFWQLHAAGIVQPLGRRVGGFTRYALIEDLGPKAPLAGRKFVYDPNKKQQHPYAESVRRAA